MKQIVYHLISTALSIIFLVSFSTANASEYDRVVNLCKTNSRLNLAKDCECLANEFVKRKASVPNPSDSRVLSGISHTCDKPDRGKYAAYASCMVSPKITNTTMDIYCRCIQDELNTLSMAKNKPSSLRPRPQEQAIIGGKAIDICNKNYMPTAKPKHVKITQAVAKQRARKNAAEFEYKKAFETEYLVCTDHGTTEGQHENKTKVLEYIKGFCPFERQIISANPTQDTEIINSVIGNMTEKHDRLYAGLKSSLGSDRSNRFKSCNQRHQICINHCRKNPNNINCGCTQGILACLSKVAEGFR